jgi:hypothetical protein
MKTDRGTTVRLIILDKSIQTAVFGSFGLVGYVQSCFSELERKYGRIPIICSFKVIYIEGVRIPPARYDNGIIELNGILFPVLWNYDAENTKMFIKFCIAHEYRHWITHITEAVMPTDEEDICNEFGANEVGKPYEEIRSNSWKVFEGAFGHK